MNKNNFIRDNIYKIWIYLLKIYSIKFILKKIVIFLISGLIVLTISFVCRQLAIDSNKQSYVLINNFLNINIIGNTGISFSLFNNNSASLIYFIQSIPIILAFIFLIFSKYLLNDFFIGLVFFGGLSNIIDRSIIDNYLYITNIYKIDAVVDYLQFSFIPNSAIFNFPDVFIVIGIISFILSILIYLIKGIRNDKKNPNK